MAGTNAVSLLEEESISVGDSSSMAEGTEGHSAAEGQIPSHNAKSKEQTELIPS